MNSIQRVEFLFEDMNSKFDFVVEALSVLQKDVNDVKQWVARIPYIERDMETFRLVYREHSQELGDHEKRTTYLEDSKR